MQFNTASSKLGNLKGGVTALKTITASPVLQGNKSNDDKIASFFRIHGSDNADNTASYIKQILLLKNSVFQDAESCTSKISVLCEGVNFQSLAKEGLVSIAWYRVFNVNNVPLYCPVNGLLDPMPSYQAGLDDYGCRITCIISTTPSGRALLYANGQGDAVSSTFLALETMDLFLSDDVMEREKEVRKSISTSSAKFPVNLSTDYDPLLSTTHYLDDEKKKKTSSSKDTASWMTGMFSKLVATQNFGSQSKRLLKTEKIDISISSDCLNARVLRGEKSEGACNQRSRQPNEMGGELHEPKESFFPRVMSLVGSTNKAPSIPSTLNAEEEVNDGTLLPFPPETSAQPSQDEVNVAANCTDASYKLSSEISHGSLDDLIKSNSNGHHDITLNDTTEAIQISNSDTTNDSKVNDGISRQSSISSTGRQLNNVLDREKNQTIRHELDSIMWSIPVASVKAFITGDNFIMLTVKKCEITFGNQSSNSIKLGKDNEDTQEENDQQMRCETLLVTDETSTKSDHDSDAPALASSNDPGIVNFQLSFEDNVERDLFLVCLASVKFGGKGSDNVLNDSDSVTEVESEEGSPQHAKLSASTASPLQLIKVPHIYSILMPKPEVGSQGWTQQSPLNEMRQFQNPTLPSESALEFDVLPVDLREKLSDALNETQDRKASVTMTDDDVTSTLCPPSPTGLDEHDAGSEVHIDDKNEPEGLDGSEKKTTNVALTDRFRGLWGSRGKPEKGPEMDKTSGACAEQTSNEHPESSTIASELILETAPTEPSNLSDALDKDLYQKKIKKITTEHNRALEKLKNQVEKLQDEIQEKKQKIQQLETANNRLAGLIKSSDDHLRNVSALQKTLIQREKELKGEKDSLREWKEKEEERLELRNKELRSMDEDASLAQKGKDAQVVQLTLQVSDLMKQLDAEADKYKSIVHDREKLLKRVAEQDGKIASSEIALKECQSELERVQKEFSLLLLERTDFAYAANVMKNQLDEAEAMKLQLGKENVQLGAENAQLTEKLEQLESAVNELTKRLEESDSMNSALQEKIDAANIPQSFDPDPIVFPIALQNDSGVHGAEKMRNTECKVRCGSIPDKNDVVVSEAGNLDDDTSYAGNKETAAPKDVVSVEDYKQLQQQLEVAIAEKKTAVQQAASLRRDLQRIFSASGGDLMVDDAETLARAKKALESKVMRLLVENEELRKKERDNEIEIQNLARERAASHASYSAPSPSQSSFSLDAALSFLAPPKTPVLIARQASVQGLSVLPPLPLTPAGKSDVKQSGSFGIGSLKKAKPAPRPNPKSGSVDGDTVRHLQTVIRELTEELRDKDEQLDQHKAAKDLLASRVQELEVQFLGRSETLVSPKL